jgi:hypothetical protein
MAIWRFRSNFAINRADEAVYIRRARGKNEILVLRDGLPVSNTRFLTAPLSHAEPLLLQQPYRRARQQSAGPPKLTSEPTDGIALHGINRD